MSSKYKFHNPTGLYFVTNTIINWIDLFIRDEYRNSVLNCWKYCIENKGMDLYAWVIMTSHIHMIVGSRNCDPGKLIGDIKKWTSTELKKAIISHQGESRKEWMLQQMVLSAKKNATGGRYQIWREDNHPIELFSPDVILQKLNYIHNNPVVAGFAREPQNYIYSSAIDYFTQSPGLINIKYLEVYQARWPR